MDTKLIFLLLTISHQVLSNKCQRSDLKSCPKKMQNAIVENLSPEWRKSLKLGILDKKNQTVLCTLSKKRMQSPGSSNPSYKMKKCSTKSSKRLQTVLDMIGRSNQKCVKCYDDLSKECCYLKKCKAVSRKGRKRLAAEKRKLTNIKVEVISPGPLKKKNRSLRSSGGVSKELARAVKAINNKSKRSKNSEQDKRKNMKNKTERSGKKNYKTNNKNKNRNSKRKKIIVKPIRSGKRQGREEEILLVREMFKKMNANIMKRIERRGCCPKPSKRKVQKRPSRPKNKAIGRFEPIAVNATKAETTIPAFSKAQICLPDTTNNEITDPSKISTVCKNAGRFSALRCNDYYECFEDVAKMRLTYGKCPDNMEYEDSKKTCVNAASSTCNKNFTTIAPS